MDMEWGFEFQLWVVPLQKIAATTLGTQPFSYRFLAGHPRKNYDSKC